MIRIGFQNVNGVKGRLDAAHEIFDVISDKELDIFGVAERISTGWIEVVKKQWQQ